MEKRPAARGEDDESKAPLLGSAWPPAEDTDTGGSSDDGGLQQDEKEEALGRRLVEENRKLWAVAGPSICTRFSTFGLTVISQAFIGHIGPTELAAYALCSTVLMRFSIGVLVWYTSCMTNYLAFLYRPWTATCSLSHLIVSPLLVFARSFFFC
jgi:MATE family multidrug resistance protein